MEMILEGILLGLTLTILLGPIFVALTQTGIEHGIRAGISVGSGIWVSDILIISATYFFIRKIGTLSQEKEFQFWMGLVGGCILIIFGLVSLFKKPILNEKTPAFNAKSFTGYWTKGFAVNFINPFTFVFWFGVMTTYVIGKGITGGQTILLFASIMSTIIITDSAKVILAKMIRSKMKPRHVYLFGKIAGTMLVIFGIVLLIKSNVVHFS
ncbi:MAG: LysE family transporter [Saprospiraceae bacterium]|nr:LysE family transporter [Saprospiraceae bacterium]